MKLKNVTAIVLAAGSGTRFGGTKNKVYELLGGRSVLSYSLQVFLVHPAVTELIIAGKEEERAEAEASLMEVIRNAGTTSGCGVQQQPKKEDDPALLCSADALDMCCLFAKGGETRAESVRHALAMAHGEVVLIHDGARPFVTSRMIDDCLASMDEAEGAMVAVPSKDTVKTADTQGNVIETIPRAEVFLGQTPQCFRTEALRKAHVLYGRDPDITDDSMCIERAGGTVKLLPGSYTNLKITTPEDLILAEALLKMN